MAKVSIGLPFYNDEKTLSLAINSTLQQSFEDFELILIDDGSTDESLHIAKSIRDSRIKIISDGNNKGLAIRLNQITSLAKGKYLARMDADDIMHPNRIEKQVEFLEENKEVDIVGTNAYSIDLNNKIIGIRKNKKIFNEIYMVFKKGLFIHPTIMGKLDWFKKNPYDETIDTIRAEDYDLWIRSFEKSTFYIIEEPLLFYRESNSICKSIGNYFVTFKSMVKIISKNGKLINFNRRVFLKGIIYFKIILYYFLWKIDRLDFIIKKRYCNLTSFEKEVARDILNSIKANSK